MDIISMVANIAMVVLTIAVVALAVAGRRDPARPRCRACRAELLAATIISGVPCPNCATSLEGPAAIRPRWRAASRRVWISLLVLLILWPVTIFGQMSLRRRAFGPGAIPASALDDDQLVRTVCQQVGPSGPLTWELVARFTRGTLDHVRARAALLEELSRPSPALSIVAQEGPLIVAHRLLQQKPDDPELMDLLLEAYEPTPALTATITPSGSIAVAVLESPRRGSGFPFAPGLFPRLLLCRVQLDGKGVDFSESATGTPRTGMPIDGNRNVIYLDAGPAPGTRTLELEFEAALFDDFDIQRLQSLGSNNRTRDEWPEAKRSQRRHATISVEIGGPPKESSAAENPPITNP